MIQEFTEEEQIRHLHRHGYRIEVKNELQMYGPEEIEVPRRIAIKNGKEMDLQLAFRLEIKKSILER